MANSAFRGERGQIRQILRSTSSLDIELQDKLAKDVLTEIGKMNSGRLFKRNSNTFS